ncbi:MAG: hypothetical protein WA942_15225, partial [Mycolicibacter sinensis]
MSDRNRSAKRNSTRKGKERRGGRVAGAGAAVSAFLAFGMGPLAHMPSAQADDFDLGDLFDPSAWALPYDGIDWNSFVDPAAWSSLFDSSAFDAATAGSATADQVGWDATWNSLMATVNSWFAGPSQAGDAAGSVPGGAWSFANSCGLWCDGAAGTAADPNGQDGGLFFGNGGAGYSGLDANGDWIVGTGGDANW